MLEKYSSIRKDQRGRKLQNKQVEHKELHLVDHKDMSYQWQLENHWQKTSVEEGPEAFRETGFQFTISPQCPPCDITACCWFDPSTGSMRDEFFAAVVFIRWRSALEPMTCPKMDAAMVKAIAVLGISTDFLSMAMNGTAAWTAANQAGENFSVCSLHIPKGTFAAIPINPITSTFAGRGCGRRFFANAVRARAARAATIAGGHLYFMPGGSWNAEATRGRTLLTARYDFAMGQFPLCSHSLPMASCFEVPPWKIN